jgi:hypothetical protein
MSGRLVYHVAEAVVLNSVLALGSRCLLVAACCGCGATPPQVPPALDPDRQAELAGWLEEHGRPPVDYVVGLFADRDVVFLGEHHRVRHDVLLVQSLIPRLHEAGVRVLATEFGRREDQPLIDALLADPEWDEARAREIVFRQLVWWGYREYVDVYRTAWERNRQLPEGAPRFRILALNDSPDWSQIRSPADRDDPAVMRRVWRGGGEEHWARVILEAVSSGDRVLVHCGIHHAFTQYRQPIVIEGRFSHFDRSLRCGNHVFEAIGARAATVFLHAPWSGDDGYGSASTYPAGGVIDAVMLAAGPKPVGFDLDDGPFGDLGAADAVYQHGYESFRLADFADGWIYTKPLSQYEGVTPIAGWVDEDNLEGARAASPNPRFRHASVEEFNRAIARDADLADRWEHLR